MGEQHYRVRVEGDHIRKLASAKPIQAAAELIWNAVDADATRVDLEIDADNIATRAISVRDNRHGIPRADVEVLFGKLGGSWKAHGNRSKNNGRMLHGKEGKGRFKALALGRVAEWYIRYFEGSKLLGYSIAIIRDKLEDVRVTEAVEIDGALGAGVDVRITELDRVFRFLDPAHAVQSLSEIFALYLTDYADVRIFVEHQRLDSSQIITSRETFELPSIHDDDKRYKAEVEIIEWRSASER